MLKDQLDREIVIANAHIDELELTTHVVAPENPLSDITTFEKASQDEINKRDLKNTYRKKRKLLFFKEQMKDNILFRCDMCGKEIELERLLMMPKARLCISCAS